MSERWQDPGAAAADGEGPLSDLGDTALVNRASRQPESVERVVAELSARHLRAVTAYASLCVSAPCGADTLAAEAIHSAVRDADPAAPDEAWRPRLLASVLKVAGQRWTDSDRHAELSPEFRDWLASRPDDVPGNTPSDDTHGADGPARPALLHRTFRGLPVHIQTVLWHDVVEREEPAAIGRLLTAPTETVRGWRGTARAKFRDAYLRGYADEGASACRPFARLVEVAAETRSISPASDLDGHLADCAYCRRAFDELSRMEDHCDTLLAEGVLAWGGARYVAQRRAVEAVAGGTDEGAHGEPEADATGRGAEPTGQEPTAEGGAPASVSAPSTFHGRGGGHRRRTAQVALTSAAICVGVIAAAALSATHHGGEDGSDAARSQDEPSISVTTTSPSPSPSTSAQTTRPPKKKKKPHSKNPPSPKPSPSKKPPKPAVSGADVRWDFTEGSGATVGDGSGRGNDGTLRGSGARSGSRGGSLSLNGSQYVEGVSGTIDTTRSYTVSAWLNLASKQDFSTAISQDGQEISGFFLQYDNSIDRWRLAICDADSSEADEDEAVSATSPVLGEWQHIVGVYDAPAKEIRLYVDGRLQDTTRHTPVWSAAGAFVVGRGKWEGTVADRFRGGIDAVGVFPRALSSSEIAALARTA
ncbi:LamG domain-containing protein [Streptomyces sp. NPDC048636]|uniref:LamG domain-containing protein n=1 Tax=Streptomyces sp. NPDC048636 TaxID=3155762 RepID=UPI00342D5968